MKKNQVDNKENEFVQIWKAFYNIEYIEKIYGSTEKWIKEILEYSSISILWEKD